LWLNVNALLTGNMLDIMTTLQAGLASGEHQAFLQQLENLRYEST
jgi:hypothetical protein